MANNKMKGLLKGLRYISQIFDGDQKEPEMQIGYPTDVKHVAHIGWDGPSPSMKEFKPPSSPGFSSAPLNHGVGEIKEQTPVKWVSEDTRGRGARATPNSQARDLPDLPKSSRRRSSTEAATAAESGVVDSPTKSKADKPRQSRRSSKSSAKELLDPTKQGQVNDTASRSLPKKTRRKNSKESSVSGRTNRSSRSKAQAADLDNGSESESVGKANNNNSEHCHASALSALEEVEQGFTGIS